VAERESRSTRSQPADTQNAAPIHWQSLLGIKILQALPPPRAPCSWLPVKSLGLLLVVPRSKGQELYLSRLAA